MRRPQPFRSVLWAAAAAVAATLAPFAAARNAPTTSTPIALVPGQPTLLCVNPDSGTITSFDVSTNTPHKLDELKVGKQPNGIAISPEGDRAFVALQGDGRVAVIDISDPEDLDVDRKIKVGKEPVALVLAPNGTQLFVANSATNDVSVIDATLDNPAVVATVDVSSFGRAPWSLAVTDDGDATDVDELVLVTLFWAELRTGKNVADEGQDDSKEGRVVGISVATDTVTGPITKLAPLANVGFNANGRLAPAVNQTPFIASVNPQAFTIQTGAFPNQLAGIAIRPNSDLAYVVSTGASPNGPFRFNSNAQGLVSLLDVTTQAEVTASQTDPNVRQTAPLNLNQGINFTPAPRLFFSNPLAIAWRPNGADAWIACQQADAIVRMTVDGNGTPTIGAPASNGLASQVVAVDLVDVGNGKIPGLAPRGIAINDAGTRAFVFNFVSRSVTAIDITNGASPTIVGTARSSKVPDPDSSKGQVHLGEELFFTGRGPDERMSSEAWGSCATCHPFGHTDNVTWMFPTGPRQTISLDGMFAKGDPHDQRLLNWSAINDETQDFELNTRGVFAGRGLIDDDRLFLAFGGTAGASETETVEQFQQFTGVVGTTNDLAGGTAFPPFDPTRRDFASATLPDGRVIIVGGRSGNGQGTLLTGKGTVLEFNPRTNKFKRRSVVGFTPRHSLGAAAVITKHGPRVYAIGGYTSTDGNANPVTTVEEFDPKANVWRTVEPLATAVAQFGVCTAGGINAAEPDQLVHVYSGNTGSENSPTTTNATPLQRFHADPKGDGVWETFNPGLLLRKNHGIAVGVRGVQSRIFVIGGQLGGGTFLNAVEEYVAQTGVKVNSPHTVIPSARAKFGIGSTLTTNQIYVVGGIDNTLAAKDTVFEYTIANNDIPGDPGNPSGVWQARANLAAARIGLQLSNPPGVTPLLAVDSGGRDERQDAIAKFIAKSVHPIRAPIAKNDEGAQRGRDLFGQVGLVIPGFSCATCHGGPKWTISEVDYDPAPSPDLGLGLGKERVVGAEVRHTKTQGDAVLIDVGTFALNGRKNEIRFNAADISQAIAPLGAAGFNIPSLLSVHATAPYFYSGTARSLENVLDGSQDGNGGVRHHFVTNAQDRADLVLFLKSIDSSTKPFHAN